MNKRKEMQQKRIRAIIIVIMVIGMALSAVAPALARLDTEIIKEDISMEEIEERVEEKERGEGEEWIRTEIGRILENLDEIAERFQDARKETKTVYARGVPVNFSFNYQLVQGATGEPIRYLQKVLNLDPETRVSASGGGAPGNETTYFGPQTRNALIRFQRKHGISGTGILGPLTRAKVNEILNSGLQVETGPSAENLEKIRKEVGEIREEVTTTLGFFMPSLSRNEKMEQCKKDIKKAHKEALGEICTMEFREMECAKVLSYGAPNGCIISFLDKKDHWK